eukprot:12439150-Heterocapsa_arctica.AAC.1
MVPDRINHIPLQLKAYGGCNGYVVIPEGLEPGDRLRIDRPDDPPIFVQVPDGGLPGRFLPFIANTVADYYRLVCRKYGVDEVAIPTSPVVNPAKAEKDFHKRHQ